MIEKLLRELQNELHEMWLFNYNEYVSGLCDYRIVSVDLLADLMRSLEPMSRVVNLATGMLADLEDRMTEEEKDVWADLKGLLR